MTTNQEDRTMSTNTMPATRMHPGIKAMWLRALRSGRYHQTRHELKTRVPSPQGNYSYCCLGVLCDVRRKVARRSWEHFVNQDTMALCETLPRTVAKWAGLEGFDRWDPRVSNGHRTMPLSWWNDKEGLSFEQIADLIEREL